MSARSMMMATGCIQAQICHTNRCPVGVATQNPRLMRAVDVEDKGNRVYNYHKLTVAEANQIMASMGASTPADLNQRMLRRRVGHLTTSSYAAIFNWMRPGELLEDPPRGWALDWEEADADHFGEFAPIPWLRPIDGQDDGEHIDDGERPDGREPDGEPADDQPETSRSDKARAVPAKSGGLSREGVPNAETGTTKRVESSAVRPESRPGD